MKIGSLVYATDQGLGVLAKSFYDHGVVNQVVVVRHHHHPTHDDWYPGAAHTPIRPLNSALVRDFCLSCDLMLFFETPFDWGLVHWCKGHGVRTVIMPMYECTPAAVPAEPDLWLCPSLLDEQVFTQRCREC